MMSERTKTVLIARLRSGEAQFRRGYGLSYRRPARVPQLPVGPDIASCPPDTY